MANNLENCVQCKLLSHWIEIRLVDEHAQLLKGKLSGSLKDNSGNSHDVVFLDGYLLQTGLSVGPVQIKISTDELISCVQQYSPRAAQGKNPVPEAASKEKSYEGTDVKYRNVTVGDLWACPPKSKLNDRYQPGATGNKLILVADNSYMLEVRAINTKENIIIIGSEVHNKSFWTQMMFIAAATNKIKSGLRNADNNVVAVIVNGYTSLELGILEIYRDKFQLDLVVIRNQRQLESLLNRNRDNVKIQDLYFYTHGYPGVVDFNYKGYVNILINKNVLEKIDKNAFINVGVIHSYACRTGMSNDLFLLEKGQFSSDKEAKPESSLAMQMAQYFNVKVNAFLTRTFYRNVIRDHSKDSLIENELKQLRNQSGDNMVYTILNKYEGLPHIGISDGWTNMGAKMAGTDGYVLWPKQGGRVQPVSDDTPKGLTKGERTFTPKGKWT